MANKKTKKTVSIHKPVSASKVKSALKTLGLKMPHGYQVGKRKRK